MTHGRRPGFSATRRLRVHPHLAEAHRGRFVPQKKETTRGRLDDRCIQLGSTWFLNPRKFQETHCFVMCSGDWMCLGKWITKTNLLAVPHKRGIGPVQKILHGLNGAGRESPIHSTSGCLIFEIRVAHCGTFGCGYGSNSRSIRDQRWNSQCLRTCHHRIFEAPPKNNDLMTCKSDLGFLFSLVAEISHKIHWHRSHVDDFDKKLLMS